MTYQQVNSTFIPKSTDDQPYSHKDTTLDDNLELIEENEELSLKIKGYESKILELEKRLKSKTQEMHSYNNVIVTLEEEIKDLKDIENKNDFTQIESLSSEMVKLQDENTKLKQEVAKQKEHAQLLYILILILVIM